MAEQKGNDQPEIHADQKNSEVASDMNIAMCSDAAAASNSHNIIMVCQSLQQKIETNEKENETLKKEIATLKKEKEELQNSFLERTREIQANADAKIKEAEKTANATKQRADKLFGIIDQIETFINNDQREIVPQLYAALGKILQPDTTFKLIHAFGEPLLRDIFKHNKEVLAYACFRRPNLYKSFGSKDCGYILICLLNYLKNVTHAGQITNARTLLSEMLSDLPLSSINGILLKRALKDRLIAEIMYDTCNGIEGVDFDELLIAYPYLILKYHSRITKKFVDLIAKSNKTHELYGYGDQQYEFETPECFERLVVLNPGLIYLGKHFSNRTAALVAFKGLKETRECLNEMNNSDARWLMSKFFPQDFQKIVDEEFATVEANAKVYDKK